MSGDWQLAREELELANEQMAEKFPTIGTYLGEAIIEADNEINIMQCNAMQCKAMQCNALQCYAMLCYAVSTMKWYVLQFN